MELIVANIQYKWIIQSKKSIGIRIQNNRLLILIPVGKRPAECSIYSAINYFNISKEPEFVKCIKVRNAWELIVHMKSRVSNKHDSFSNTDKCLIM